jgi:hypothetical protein
VSELRELLFKHGVVLPGAAIFEDQAALARSIAGGTRQVATVRAFINQALNHKRPFSASLKDLIINAAAERVNGADAARDLEVFRQQLKDSFLEFETQRRRKPALGGVEEFEELESESRKAEKFFIITYKPAETTRTATAEILSNDLVDRLNLASDEKGAAAGRDVSYEFYLSDHYEGCRLWRVIHMRFAQQPGMSEVEAKQHLQNLAKKGRIKVKLLKPYLCVHHTLVLDPDRPNKRGFVLNYLPDNRISISKMSELSLSAWYYHVFLPITAGDKEFVIQEITLEEALPLEEAVP